jgi:4-hydroxythreonine-4-phosphate dehydrogenase
MTAVNRIQPRRPRRFALTLGDPAGVGPEIALRALAADRSEPLDGVEVVLVGERAALAAALPLVPEIDRDALVEVHPAADAAFGLARGAVALFDPVGRARTIAFGESGAADAHAALAALDAAIALAKRGAVDAIVTAPVSKGSIAAHVAPGFVGHTDHLAAAFGLERYGRDYLMAFLSAELQVALLSVHEPLVRAIRGIEHHAVVDALLCLGRHAGGRIALAGLNPHAGEGGLLGREDDEILRPAVAAARAQGVDVHGPESADSLFARQRRGEFDWVLALYHDQGLIAVKTASFGAATNWTLGLPVVRTSVDHGTAFALAGTGRADARPMTAVLETTVALLDGRLPRRTAPGLNPRS